MRTTGSRSVTDIDRCTTQFTVEDDLTESEARYQFENIHRQHASTDNTRIM